MVAIILIIGLLFRLTVSQDARSIVLRYPVEDGVTWLSVCVESEGIDPYTDRPVYLNSCWEPRRDYSFETYKLREGTRQVRAHLKVNNKGVEETIHTPVVRVKP